MEGIDMKKKWENPKIIDVDGISVNADCTNGESNYNCRSGSGASSLCDTGTGASACDEGNSAVLG